MKRVDPEILSTHYLDSWHNNQDLVKDASLLGFVECVPEGRYFVMVTYLDVGLHAFVVGGSASVFKKYIKCVLDTLIQIFL